MTRLCTLRNFNLDHLHLVENRVLNKQILTECAVLVSTTEVAGTNLPNKVASLFAMIRGEPSLSGALIKVAFFCPRIHRQNGRRAQRSVTHGRNI